MNRYFADFHIHVGISEAGQWVKIPTSRNLTVRTILDTALQRKGLQIVAIVDAMSPYVQQDIQRLVDEGRLTLQSGGGYLYHNGVSMLLGAEIETCETVGGMCHSLLYLPDLSAMQALSREMSQHIRNIGLSSQNAHMPLRQLAGIARSHEALFIPAHAFTPHKSLYGSCTGQMAAVLSETDIAGISAIELGLSADTAMADRIRELWGFEFLTNSDAHSPEKIGREYNLLELAAPSYAECALAFKRRNDRRVLENFGMDPRLGKYHHSCCQQCDTIFAAVLNAPLCPNCGGKKLVKGVADRIEEIADAATDLHPPTRPTYRYQVPLYMLPGLGSKTLDKLVNELGTEMELIHAISLAEIERVGGRRAALAIAAVRAGTATVQSGGGGTYGKVGLP
jgi:uncharacterized protein (TIGR00375 family)